MSRYRAAGIHLIASALVLLVIFAIVQFVWYPGVLFGAASGNDLMQILIPIDLVIGPLLTLIVFNIKKPSLKFDMAIILLCQIGFAVYGMWSIFSARPVYIAFVEDQFYLATANEVDSEDQLKAKIPDFRSLPLLGPIVVGTSVPDDPEVQETMLYASWVGMGPQSVPEYFIAYEDVRDKVKHAGKTADQIDGLDEAKQQFLSSYAAARKIEQGEILFLPLMTKNEKLFISIRAENAEILEILQAHD